MPFRVIFRPPRSDRRGRRPVGRTQCGTITAPGRFVRSKIRISVTITASAVVIIFAGGCGKPPDMRDQRLAEFAHDVMKTQKEQNDRIADQSQAVVRQSQHVAEAARDLVRHDAEARREMVLVHADLVGRLDKQRSVVEEARDRLEQERIEIAQRRNRDPVIAKAVEFIGLSILCLLPVTVSLYVIRQMTAGHADDAVVAELLTNELARTAPKLFAQLSAPVPTIEDTGGRSSPPGSSGHHLEQDAEDYPGSVLSEQRSSGPMPGEDPDDDPEAWMSRIDFPEEEDDFYPDGYPDRFRRE